MQLVLPRLISPNQSAFVRGRNIVHITLLSHELTRSLNSPSAKGRSCLKLDLRKAFDSMRWEFLEMVLRVLQSFSYYWTAAFSLPTMTHKVIEQLLRNFLWAGDSTNSYKCVVKWVQLMAWDYCLFYVHYLDSLGTNFSHGVNFATAGSTIRPQNESLAIAGFSPFSLDIQLSQFAQFKLRSQWVAKQGGVFKDLMPEQKYFSRALYTIDIGANDVLQGYIQNLTDEEIRAIIHDALGVLASSIKSLYDGGGRFFWVHNTLPFGCLPYKLVVVPPTADETDGVGCSIPLNKMAEYFNCELNKTVVQLTKELPLAVLTYVDIYSAKYKLISQTAKYGFEYPLKACCGYGGGKYNFNISFRCGIPVVVNGTPITVRSCEYPSTRITFDGIHFTEAANKWIFDHIKTGDLIGQVKNKRSDFTRISQGTSYVCKQDHLDLEPTKIDLTPKTCPMSKDFFDKEFEEQ
ncbi:GDSL esterase/lipase [Acorus calamus]|uniref:GDSL esterase/lipase n=1 Tax=Acorus calamus TaxID=4465 RepID=A0AAV9D4M7_ACOCL|nr:GDSL esterase/lipase [Acorus calamus]